MIALVALLNVSQPLPWLDRNWINHQARREMLVAASASTFDPAMRVRAATPVPLLPVGFAWGAASARRRNWRPVRDVVFFGCPVGPRCMGRRRKAPDD